MAIVSKVPTEVLSEIFYLLCRKPIYVSQLDNLCCADDFPWYVGLVCRQWRTVFLSYPPIWASLNLSETSETPIKSYANEVNRRLALYLERSGGYPLRLNVKIYQNRSFATMTLKTLSTCAHRWRTVKFSLDDEWQVGCILSCKGKFPTLERLEIKVLGAISKHARDIFEVAPRLTHANVGQCAKNQGWILPYTQLTELLLSWDLGSAYPSGGVLDLLPMLHNVNKLRLRFDYQLDREGGLPQFAPTPLNHLCILEVPHPAVLSWFKTPSLCDLYVADDLQDNNEPLDVQGQMSSLIQRSGCQIRKLSFRSCRKIHVGTLKDVEELEIHSEKETRSSIDISSLPSLRFLTIIDVIHRDIEPLMNSIITALESAKVPPRNECSAGTTPISRLERVTVELRYYVYEPYEPPKIPKRLLEIADKWPLVVFRTRRS